MVIKPRFLGILCLFIACLVGGCQPAPKAHNPRTKRAEVVVQTAPKLPVLFSTPYYMLQAGDFIRVEVSGEPDTLIERKINADGTIDIPFFKKLVPVAGLTIAEAQIEMSKQCRVFFKNPEVTISLLISTFQGVMPVGLSVIVKGFVAKPGPVSFPAKGKLTLAKALAEAGGALLGKHRSDVDIMRRTREGVRFITVQDLRKIMAGDAPDFDLEAGDILFVTNGN